MKKLLASLLCVVMVVCFMPSMAFADASATDASTKGSIEAITDVAVVSGDTISVSGSSLQWFAKDESVGRYQDGWWVGFNIVSPTGLDKDSVENVKYSNDGTDNLANNFGTNKDGQKADGRYYMGCWLPVTPEYLEGALAHNAKLKWTYKFDWNGDGTVDQTFIATVDPKNITLNKEGKVECKTENGVMTIKDGKLVRPYIPTTQTPTIESDENATVTLSDYGTKATIKVADGYELADVTVNGVSKGKVDTLTGLKTGDKVVVTTKKIETPVDPAPEAARIKAGVENTTLKIYSGKTGKGHGWIQIRWVKSKGFKVDGYEVYRGKTKSSMKKYDTTKKTSYKNAKYLKKGNRYYYKVRGYRMVGGEKVYTKWSKTIYRIAI